MRKLLIVLFLWNIFFTPLLASAEARRIVSLYPGHTDNIVALGAGDRIVGVSRSDDPELLPTVPRLPPKVGAEEILALKPDVVFSRSLIERLNPHLSSVLERAGISVYVIDPPSWEGFEGYLLQLAEILGTDPEAARLKLIVSRETIARNAALAGTKPPKVFLEATSKELHTCAPDSWAAHLIQLAGGVNAAENAAPLREASPLASWGIERVLHVGGQGLDVYLVQQGAMNAVTLDEVRGRSWFRAFKNVRLEAIPESCLSRPSLPGLEKGGKILLYIFYGEAREAPR